MMSFSLRNDIVTRESNRIGLWKLLGHMRRTLPVHGRESGVLEIADITHICSSNTSVNSECKQGTCWVMQAIVRC